MKFNFDWNYVSSGGPFITISDIGIGFNSPAIALLNNPSDIIIGFDEENMTLGIKEYAGEENIKAYKFYDRVKNGWIRIGCRDFVKRLSELSGIPFSPARKFVANYDADEKILYITVNAQNIVNEDFTNL